MLRSHWSSSPPLSSSELEPSICKYMDVDNVCNHGHTLLWDLIQDEVAVSTVDSNKTFTLAFLVSVFAVVC